MSDTRYFDLSIKAPQRLAMMRAAFAAHPTRYPHCPEHAKPTTWRNVRGWGFHNWQAAFATFSGGQQSDGSKVWVTHQGPYFRREQYCDIIKRMDHRGWFTDTDAQETARGIVARLPHGRFLAGYEWSSNGERVYFAEVFTDDEDAARMSDEHARIFADNAREDSERFDAMQTAETDNEDKFAELEESLQRLREFLALRHANGFAYARDRVHSIIETIRTQREELETTREELATATRNYERGT